MPKIVTSINAVISAIFALSYVLLPAYAQAGDEIIVRLEEMQACKYSSGGRPSTNGHHVCKLRYSLLNTTQKAIKMDSGTSLFDEIYPGYGRTKAGIGYPTPLYPGKKMKLGATCYVAHGRSMGSLRLAGGGHFLGEKRKNTVKWSLSVTCPQLVR